MVCIDRTYIFLILLSFVSIFRARTQEYEVTPIQNYKNTLNVFALKPDARVADVPPDPVPE